MCIKKRRSGKTEKEKQSKEAKEGKMDTCNECGYFVAGGTVPEGKDGSCIRREKDLREGMVTYSRPVSKAGSCQMFKEEKKGGN